MPNSSFRRNVNYRIQRSNLRVARSPSETRFVSRSTLSRQVIKRRATEIGRSFTKAIENRDPNLVSRLTPIKTRSGSRVYSISLAVLLSLFGARELQAQVTPSDLGKQVVVTLNANSDVVNATYVSTENGKGTILVVPKSIERKLAVKKIIPDSDDLLQSEILKSKNPQRKATEVNNSINTIAKFLNLSRSQILMFFSNPNFVGVFVRHTIDFVSLTNGLDPNDYFWACELLAEQLRAQDENKGARIYEFTRRGIKAGDFFRFEDIQPLLSPLLGADHSLVEGLRHLASKYDWSDSLLLQKVAELNLMFKGLSEHEYREVSNWHSKDFFIEHSKSILEIISKLKNKIAFFKALVELSKRTKDYQQDPRRAFTALAEVSTLSNGLIRAGEYPSAFYQYYMGKISLAEFNEQSTSAEPDFF